LEVASLNLKLIIGVFLVSLAFLAAAYVIGRVQRKKRVQQIDSKQDSLAPTAITEKHANERIENQNPQHAQIAAMKLQYESEITSLKSEHQREIRGRDAAFDTLKRDKEILSTQNKELNAYITQYSWLHNIAGAQASEIDQYVTLDRIERGDIQLNEGVPYVKFGIYVLNNSVFDVTLELASNSYIVFRDTKLNYPIDVVTDGLRNVKYQTTRCLVIEQRLSTEEAHYIASCTDKTDPTFYFDNVNLIIKGGNHQPKVTPKRLDINKGVTLHNKPLTFGR